MGLTVVMNMSMVGGSIASGVKSQLSQTVSQGMAALEATAENTKDSLAATVSLPGAWGSAASSGMQTAIADMIGSWMLNHPIAAWFVSHPLVTLGLVLVLLVLLRGLLGAIARLTEQIWLAVLRLPIALAGWFFSLGSGLLNRAALPSPDQSTQQQQLATLLDKLDALRLEQDELIKEVRAILNSEQ